MKRMRFYLGAAFVGISCFVGIPMIFIGEDFMGDLVAKGLDLKVSPGFVGGTAARSFIDEIPEEKNLKSYKVYQPVYDGVWQKNPDYWQLEQRYDVDSRKFSSVNVVLKDDFENEYLLNIGKDGTFLIDEKGTMICACENYFMDGGKLIKTRIPLKEKRLQKFYITKNTEHTVYADNEMQISQNVNMKEKEVKKDMKGIIEKIKDSYYEMKSTAPNDGFKTGNEGFDLAYSLFMDGDAKRAEALFKTEVEKNKDDPLANAYYGSCLAIRGGNSNVFSAMGLVKKAYIYLDRGVELSAGKEYEFHARMNRAEVSASVPNAVFGKLETGAMDFERAAEILLAKEGIPSEYDRTVLAYIYASAAECYIGLGKEFEASLSIKKAEKILSD